MNLVTDMQIMVEFINLQVLRSPHNIMHNVPSDSVNLYRIALGFSGSLRDGVYGQMWYIFEYFDPKQNRTVNLENALGGYSLKDTFQWALLSLMCSSV